ncbi:MAG: hypothetical protein LBH36_01090 [Candidatus Nomurabacteria bacterium]|jgi:hypothetical protein|nr:hypothetical protein [Candidatus Nomurabacteria bacterium]
MSEFKTNVSPSPKSFEAQLDTGEKPISEISREDIEAITDPEELRTLLLATLEKTDELEEKLASIDIDHGSKKANTVAQHTIA